MKSLKEILDKDNKTNEYFIKCGCPSIASDYMVKFGKYRIALCYDCLREIKMVVNEDREDKIIRKVAELELRKK